MGPPLSFSHVHVAVQFKTSSCAASAVKLDSSLHLRLLCKPGLLDQPFGTRTFRSSHDCSALHFFPFFFCEIGQFIHGQPGNDCIDVQPEHSIDMHVRAEGRSRSQRGVESFLSFACRLLCCDIMSCCVLSSSHSLFAVLLWPISSHSFLLWSILFSSALCSHAIRIL